MSESSEQIRADKQAYDQNQLALERTRLSEIRTELTFSNSKLAVDRTHLAYLRTIVSLIGSGATIYKALPLLGISESFTVVLTLFLLFSAVYFIYKDATTCPKMKRKLEEMHEQVRRIEEERKRGADIKAEPVDADGTVGERAEDAGVDRE